MPCCRNICVCNVECDGVYAHPHRLKLKLTSACEGRRIAMKRAMMMMTTPEPGSKRRAEIVRDQLSVCFLKGSSARSSSHKNCMYTHTHHVLRLKCWRVYLRA